MTLDTRPQSGAALFAPTLTAAPVSALVSTLALMALLALALLLFAPGAAEADSGLVHTGSASYYHDKFQGRKTASGKAYDKNKMTAAHKHLPLGTIVRVTDQRTGRSVEVLINDRGPFVKGRIIDLSRRAATELGMIKRGTAPVKVEVLDGPRNRGT